MQEPSAWRERRRTLLSVTAAAGLILGICVFALLIVFAQSALAALIVDGLSVYLALMVVMAVAVWLLTFAYMRQLGQLEGRR